MNENKSLLELQRVEFEILKAVVKICNDNNIKYYMIGGTLLGSVRHKGFIPWDDDIDIAMFRDDYNKFVDIWPKIRPDDLVLQNKETDKRVHISFTKIRKKGTRIIEKETKNSGIFKGVFIDIFPLDNIPKEDSLYKDLEYYFYYYLISVSLYKNGYRSYKSKLLKNISAISSLFLSFELINKVSNYIITRQHNVETDYVTSYTSGYGYKKQRMNKKKIYGDGVLLQFEDCEFIAPTNFIDYLVHLFGDYKQLPPKEKRGSQHSFIEVDLENE